MIFTKSATSVLIERPRPNGITLSSSNIKSFRSNGIFHEQILILAAMRWYGGRIAASC